MLSVAAVPRHIGRRFGVVMAYSAAFAVPRSCRFALFFQPRFCRWLIFFIQNAVKKVSHNSQSIGISVFPLDSLSWNIGFVRLRSQSPTRKCPCFLGWCGAQKMIGARPGVGAAEKGAGPSENGYAICLTFILGSCRFQSL